MLKEEKKVLGGVTEVLRGENKVLRRRCKKEQTCQEGDRRNLRENKVLKGVKKVLGEGNEVLKGVKKVLGEGNEVLKGEKGCKEEKRCYRSRKRGAKIKGERRGTGEDID